MSQRRYADAESTLRYRQQNLKSYCKTHRLNYNLPEGYLGYLWRNQVGLCFYTDQEMTFGRFNDPGNLSVDKIVPVCGYVVGNVVLCTRRVNLIKNDMSLQEMMAWTPGWYERLCGFLPTYNQGSFPMSLYLNQ